MALVLSHCSQFCWCAIMMHHKMFVLDQKLCKTIKFMDIVGPVVARSKLDAQQVKNFIVLDSMGYKVLPC